MCVMNLDKLVDLLYDQSINECFGCFPNFLIHSGFILILLEHGHIDEYIWHLVSVGFAAGK